MTMKLYKIDVSPAARAVMMACEIVGVQVEMVDINLSAGEHMTPEFLKKTPLHTVPVLEDDDLTIIDSHAILMYLVDAYGKNDSIYPKDIQQRALVNQLLYFNTAILYNRLRNITIPAYYEGQRKITVNKLKDIEEAYGFVEEFLSRHKFIATDELTIADLAVSASVSSLGIIIPLDVDKYPKIRAWLEGMQKENFYRKCNEPGLKLFDALLHAVLDL